MRSAEFFIEKEYACINLKNGPEAFGLPGGGRADEFHPHGAGGGGTADSQRI